MTAIASLRTDSQPSRDVGVQPALSALRSSAWFAGWPSTALATLSVSSSLRSFGPGQMVAPEGKSLSAVILVIKGRIRAVRRGEAGREVTLETFREGELSIDALFDPSAVLANEWVAAETSLLLFIPRDEFLSQVRMLPEAALVLARDFEKRLTRAKSLVAGLVLADVESRLYNALVTLARDEGEQTPEGTVIGRCPTQQEMGNTIGACRETVSRIIAELTRKGLVTLRGRRLTLAPGFFQLTAVSGQA